MTHNDKINLKFTSNEIIQRLAIILHFLIAIKVYGTYKIIQKFMFFIQNYFINSLTLFCLRY